MSNSPLIHSSEKDFEADVLKSDLPVLVDFWADWCGPCRVVGPVVEGLSKDYSGRMRFVKVNVDANPGLSEKYGIQGIPTLMTFKGGQEAGRIVGAAPRDHLVQEIDKVLGS